MCVYFVAMLCVGKFGLGWVRDAFKFTCHMLMHFHVYIPSIIYIMIYCCWYFSDSLSLSCVSLLLWHLNANVLHPWTLCILGHLLPLILHHLLFGFVMRTLIKTSRRTFVDEAFIRNAMSFCQTFLTLTYPLSFTVGVGSHFVASRSFVPSCLYKSFISIYMESILQYLISFLTFEVCAL